MHQIPISAGSAPDPAGGALSPPNPLYLDLRGPTSKERGQMEMEKGKGRGKTGGGEGKGGRKRGGGCIMAFGGWRPLTPTSPEGSRRSGIWALCTTQRQYTTHPL